MYIDTHCHLNFKAFEHDAKEVLEESLREHVQMIIIGTDRLSSEKAVEIANKYGDGVWATVGFHPIHVVDRDWRAEIQYVRVLAKDKKVIAIGEIGLDYYRLPTTATTTSDVYEDTSDVKKAKTDQETVFKFFLDIASEVSKPLMLHCREAEEDFLNVLEGYQSGKRVKRDKGDKPLRPLTHLAPLPPFPIGQWHCFGGTTEQAQKALKIGLNLGFTGLITYNSQWDKIIESFPLDRIMTETDSPYLTPEPYRGQRNEPKYVKEVVKRIAELKQLSIEEVEKQIYLNARGLYKLT